MREAIEAVRAELPFRLEAIALLPDHWHCLMQLPQGETDFSGRVGRIKSGFTGRWLTAGGIESPVSISRGKHRERGVRQHRFWQHTIRDERDYIAHMDYIHYSPVKHGLVRSPHAWPYSSFHRCVAEKRYPADWQCSCGRPTPVAPNFSELPLDNME